MTKSGLHRLPAPQKSEVIAARLAGLSYPKIAAKFSASRNSIVVICRKAGLVGERIEEFPEGRPMTAAERRAACAAHLNDLRSFHPERIAA